MSALEEFDQQLAEYWCARETRRTLPEWLTWLEKHGLSVSPSQVNSSSTQPVNYQDFLKACQQVWSSQPQWLKQLTSLEWLEEQQLLVFPQTQSSGSTPSYLEQRVHQLTQEMQILQQRVMLLEHRPVSSPQRSAPARAAAPVERPPAPSKPKTAKGNFTVTSQKLTKKEPEAKPAKPAEKQSLRDIYLSFNDWCRNFEQAGHSLQPFSNGALPVASSHRISLTQFVHRARRKMEDFSGFEQAVQAFEKQHRDGLVPLVSEESNPAVESKDSPETPALASAEKFAAAQAAEAEARITTTGFQTPPPDLYHAFNDWLQWLEEQGIVVQNYASEDLQVASSHQISFTQFCRRVERKLDDVTAFQHALGS